MKNILLFSLFVLVVNTSLAQQAHLKAIKIVYVDFEFLTIANISCADFESSFNKTEYKTKIITDTSITRDFEYALGKIRAEKRSRNLNVRVKIFLSYGEYSYPAILCVSKFYDMEYNGNSIKKNSRLISLLKLVMQ